MNTIEALDIFFDFIPKNKLERMKKEGLYDPILSGRAKDGAELYEYLSEKHAAVQDANYCSLATDIAPYLKKGSILQIGCGRGDLLFRLLKFDFQILYGIDRCDVMLKRARERLKNSAYFFNARVEDFDLSIIGKVDNVIMNNFWGMLDEKTSKNLLFRLKTCLKQKGCVVIGPCGSEKKSSKRLEAENVVKNNLNFIFSYPFFSRFEDCGYSKTKMELENGVYYFLNL